MDGTTELICEKCGKALEKRKTEFHYLGSVFYHDVPACPDCGQVFIPFDLARGKMREVEKELEDK